MKRIVVKIGTKVLSCKDGTLDVEFLERFVEQIVELRNKGTQVVIVTSGAVGAGKSLVKIVEERTETVQKQIFAAIGQVKLMTTYSEFFAKHGFYCAQVLATKEDFRDDVHYQNMQNCFEGLLLDNVIPIVNENDVVATTELLFTDNDELAGLVAKQLRADCLVILTSTEGVLDDAKQTISVIDASNIEKISSYITPEKSTGGRGGMTSKFATAKDLSKNGVLVCIANGQRPNVLVGLIEGESIGTRFIPINK